MNFVHQLKMEGVIIEEAPEDGGLKEILPLIIEIDKEKDLKKLDIQLPILTYRYERDFSSLGNLDINKMPSLKITIKKFQTSKKDKIPFRDTIENKIG